MSPVASADARPCGGLGGAVWTALGRPVQLVGAHLCTEAWSVTGDIKFRQSEIKQHHP